jgi:protein-tyrosine phosphatase
MELILHPTIKQKQEISYHHIVNLNEKLDIYIGNDASREAEHFDYIIEIGNEQDEYPPLSYQPIDILSLSFNDVRTYNIVQHKDIITEFINKCKGKLLIHCGEGISRSPSILIMYLMNKYTYSEAYQFVSSKRYIKPNIGFVKQLRAFIHKK